MASPAIRARVAPTALLVAFAFVIVGFLRVDREIMRAEEDRATLVATDAATLVELFLIRQLAQLQSISETIADQLRSGYPFDSIANVIGETARTETSFNSIWLADSGGNVLGAVGNYDGRNASVNSAHIEPIARAHHT